MNEPDPAAGDRQTCDSIRRHLIKVKLRGTIRGDLLTNVNEAMGWEPLGFDTLALRDILPR